MADRGRLSITRRPGQKIDLHYEGDLKVTVMTAAVSKSRVRLLIDAPLSVKVIRDDVVAPPPQGMVGRRIET